VPRVELACGGVGDDGDVMAAQPVSPALRLMAGRAACMTAVDGSKPCSSSRQAYG
jgi:hypothetical protein